MIRRLIRWLTKELGFEGYHWSDEDWLWYNFERKDWP